MSKILIIIIITYFNNASDMGFAQLVSRYPNLSLF